MKMPKKRFIFAGCCLLILLLSMPAWARDLLPEGVVIQQDFQPGYGLPVGSVVLVQGEVVILHSGQTIGYRAKKDLPMYKGDTVVSRPKGRLQLRMKDQSIITLASNTKLVLTHSVFEPKKKTRSSFLGLSLGKLRFWVKKLADFKRSQFKVKSPTAIIGVRGSEGIITATDDSTSLVTGPDTVAEVVPTATPDAEPTVLVDFQEVSVDVAGLPSEIQTISPEEYGQSVEAFGVPGQAEPEVSVQPQAEGGAGEEGAATSETETVLVDDQELVAPESIEEQAIPQAQTTFDQQIAQQQEINQITTDIQEQQSTINQQVREDTVNATTSLPDFPGTPE